MDPESGRSTLGAQRRLARIPDVSLRISFRLMSPRGIAADWSEAAVKYSRPPAAPLGERWLLLTKLGEGKAELRGRTLAQQVEDPEVTFIASGMQKSTIFTRLTNQDTR